MGYEFYLNKTVKGMGMKCEKERLQVTGTSLCLAMFTLTVGLICFFQTGDQLTVSSQTVLGQNASVNGCCC